MRGQDGGYGCETPLKYSIFIFATQFHGLWQPRGHTVVVAAPHAAGPAPDGVPGWPWDAVGAGDALGMGPRAPAAALPSRPDPSYDLPRDWESFERGGCVQIVVIAKRNKWKREGRSKPGGRDDFRGDFGIKAGKSLSCGEEDAAIVRAETGGKSQTIKNEDRNCALG